MGSQRTRVICTPRVRVSIIFPTDCRTVRFGFQSGIKNFDDDRRCCEAMAGLQRDMNWQVASRAAASMYSTVRRVLHK